MLVCSNVLTLEIGLFGMNDAESLNLNVWPNGHRKALEALLRGEFIEDAARAAGKRETDTLRQWRRADPAYNAAFEEAIRLGIPERGKRGIRLMLATVGKAQERLDESGEPPRPADLDAAYKLAQAYDSAFKSKIEHSGAIANESATPEELLEMARTFIANRTEEAGD